VQQYSITPSSGTLAASAAPVATATFPIALALHPSGQFAYVVNQTSGDVSAFAVDAATGALSPVAHSPFAAGSQPHAIAID
jgi:6-phosphogluconolactonase (cycloisomerase 2 family)